METVDHTAVELADLLQSRELSAHDVMTAHLDRIDQANPYVSSHGSAIVSRRDHAAGAIIVGKTNTPEFETGSQTFNEVFGVTRNPWDLSKSAGGNSGGAAAALASRMLPIADGSDLGSPGLGRRPRFVHC